MTPEGLAGRGQATYLAQEITAQVDQPKRIWTTYDVLGVLQLCGFRQNTNRKSVIEDCVKWVHSDTFGFVRFKSGDFMIADAPQGWPNVI